MGARLILIHGRIQRHEDIIHVVLAKLEDRSDWLSLLSEQAADMKVPASKPAQARMPREARARGPCRDCAPPHAWPLRSSEPVVRA